MNDPFLLHRSDAAELFLIRHAHAIPEPEEIIPSGIYDDLPLSKKGREQAQLLAERLKNIEFQAAYTSPLRRCRETGAPLLTGLELTPLVIENLREVRLGNVIDIPILKEGENLEPLSTALHQRQQEITRLAAIAGHWDAVPESESSREFRHRVVEAIDTIAQQHKGDRVLVFAHGGTINAYVADVLGMEKEFFFPCANTSITIVRASAQRRVLYVMNDIAHLRFQ